MSRLSFLIASVTAALLIAQTPPTPAQYRAGALPAVPTHAAGGGEVALEVLVNRSGSVSEVTVLRSTPPFTDALVTAVRGWQFRPAVQEGPIESAVLVAALFRPPTLTGSTLGSSPTNLTPSRPDVPFPTKTVTPSYPPRAIDNRVVLVEVHVGPTGNVTDAKAVGASSGFDDAAVKAARDWVFRPAEIAGMPAPTIAYIVFGFRQPITALNWPVGYFTTNPASYIRP